MITFASIINILGLISLDVLGFGVDLESIVTQKDKPYQKVCKLIKSFSSSTLSKFFNVLIKETVSQPESVSHIIIGTLILAFLLLDQTKNL